MVNSTSEQRAHTSHSAKCPETDGTTQQITFALSREWMHAND
jgi:hypothetical protein